jgi:hypothetical protein
MNSRREHILRVLSSIAVGIMAFCLTLPAAIFLGALLFDFPEGHALFSSEDVVLFSVSILLAGIAAISVGIKYYYLESQKDDL